MKLKDGFVLREIAGEWMAIAVGTRTAEFPGVIALSETAAFVWKRLEEGDDLERIVTAVTEEFDVDIDTARKDTEEFIKQLCEKGLLVNE